VKLSEFGVGLIVTALPYLVTTGISVRLGMDGGPALLVALPVWAAMAAGFVRAMKGTPAPRRA
jgi:hypothetical protein